MDTNRKAPTAGEQVQGLKQRRKNIRPLTGQQRRLALALLSNSQGVGISRENSDRVAHASNSPNVVWQLRAKGVQIATERVPFITCDNTESWYGRYHLAPESRQRLRELLGEG